MERVSTATVLGSCTPEKAKDDHTLIFLFFFKRYADTQEEEE